MAETSRPTLTAIVTAHAATPWAIIRNLDIQTIKPDQILVGVSDWWTSWPNDSGTELTVVRAGLPDVELTRYKNMNDFGYDKRNKLLEHATSEFVGFFCHDDSYHQEYLEKMLDAVSAGADVAFCNYLDYTVGVGFTPEFHACDCTLGNFIVRTELMRKIGGFRTEGMHQLMHPKMQVLDQDTTKYLQMIYQSLIETEKGWRDEGSPIADSVAQVMAESPAVGFADGVAIEMIRAETDKIVKVPIDLFAHNMPYWNTVPATAFGRPV